LSDGALLNTQEEKEIKFDLSGEEHTISIDSVNGRIWTTHGLNPLITWNDPFQLTDSNIKWVCVMVAYTDRK